MENVRRQKRKEGEENCQGDLQQGNYLDGQIKGMTKNIGEDLKKTGDGRKRNEEKYWR